MRFPYHFWPLRMVPFRTQRCVSGALCCLITLALGSVAPEAIATSDTCRDARNITTLDPGTYAGSSAGTFSWPGGSAQLDGVLSIDVYAQGKADGTYTGKTRTTTGHGTNDVSSFSGDVNPPTGLLLGATGMINMTVERTDCREISGKLVPGMKARGMPHMTVTGSWSVRKQGSPSELHEQVEEALRQMNAEKAPTCQRARELGARAAQLGQALEKKRELCLQNRLINGMQPIMHARLKSWTSRFPRGLPEGAPFPAAYLNQLIAEVRQAETWGLRDCGENEKAWELMRKAAEQRVNQLYGQRPSEDNFRELLDRLRASSVLGSDQGPDDPRFRDFALKSVRPDRQVQVFCEMRISPKVFGLPNDCPRGDAQKSSRGERPPQTASCVVD